MRAVRLELCYNFTMLDSPSIQRLRPKQRAFVAHYLNTWNASEAARRAGYTKAASVMGAQLLAKGSVQLALEAKFRELEATNHETLIDLNRMARGAMQFFFNPDTDDFDFTSEEARANIDLIKSITIERNERLDKDGNVIGITTKKRLEVTDKLAARTVLAKVQGLLSQQEGGGNSIVNNTLVIQSPEQARDTGLDQQQVAIELQRLLAQWQQSPPPTELAISTVSPRSGDRMGEDTVIDVVP